MIKSPMNYTGGKSKLLPDLLAIFPKEINTFVDLFAGGLNVGLNVDSKHLIANDQLTYLIEIYAYLKVTPIDTVLNCIQIVIDRYQLSQTNQEGYLLLREDYNKHKSPLYLLVLSFYSFNHIIRFNNDFKFNAPFGKNRSRYNERIEKNLIHFTHALQSRDVKLLAKDFREVNIDALTSNDFVYVDPPYLLSTATYNDHRRGFKPWSIELEKELCLYLDQLNERGIRFGFSNVLHHKEQTHPFLEEWVDDHGYTLHYLEKTYAFSNYQRKAKQSKTTEVLITNT